MSLFMYTLKEMMVMQCLIWSMMALSFVNKGQLKQEISEK